MNAMRLFAGISILSLSGSNSMQRIAYVCERHAVTPVRLSDGRK